MHGITFCPAPEPETGSIEPASTLYEVRHMIKITDEMIEVGLEAFSRHHYPLKLEAYVEAVITAVAPLVAAAERDANATVAEAMQQVIGALPGSSISSTCVEIAAAIRARGGEA